MVKTNSNQGEIFDSFPFLSTIYSYMKMIRIICENCKKECEKPAKEIKRQIKQGRKKFYCSISCSAFNLKTTTKKIKSNCLFCGKEIETTTHKKHKKCCNKLCATKYSQSFVSNERRKEGRRKYLLSHPPKGKTIYNLICAVCKNVFQNKQKHIKTCSDICYKKLISKLSRENPNCGGETNYKKYKYKNIWMDSSWELNLAKWLDENNIKWERNRKHVFWWTDENNKKRRYYPDFFLLDYNVYLDTKNPYLMECDKNKINNVLKENNIKLLCGNINDIKQKVDNILIS